MIDIETLGTRPGSVITQIGAVSFYSNHGEPIAIGYESLNLALGAQPQLENGMTMDLDTVKWWMGQSVSPFAANPISPFGALHILRNFAHDAAEASDQKEVRIWCYGANFDNVLLEAAFAKFGLESPWSYRQVRCLRTFFAIFPRVDSGQEFGAKHGALADAQKQASDLIATAEKHGIDLGSV